MVKFIRKWQNVYIWLTKNSESGNTLIRNNVWIENCEDSGSNRSGPEYSYDSNSVTIRICDSLVSRNNGNASKYDAWIVFLCAQLLKMRASA